MINQDLIDKKYMQRCIELAIMGSGNVSPNPMVGAVVVVDDEIIGEGYHIKYGESHAEVNAINSVKDKSLFYKSTLYVNLEPCSHFGKTPPCADYIINQGIKRVVIATIDYNTKVCGEGIKKLKNAGVEVIVGVLEKDSVELNKRFLNFHRNGKPFVILKWAESFDGFIDKKRVWANESPEWLTNDISRTIVHKMRAMEDAIMIGTNTAIADNPELSVREWTGNNPIRIVLDQFLMLDRNLKIFNKPQNTIVFNEKQSEIIDNVEFVKINFDKLLIDNILENLVNRKIMSLLVEGGAMLIKSFIEKDLWDEAFVFKGVNNLGEGIHAPKIKGKIIDSIDLHGIKLNKINKLT